MAYQNVGTPRFYINCYEYLEAIGALSIPESHGYLRTNPTKDFVQKSPDDTDQTDGHNDVTALVDCPVKWEDLVGDKGFAAFLGHNMGSCGAHVGLTEGQPNWNEFDIEEGIANCGIPVDYHINPEHNGFSIFTGSFAGFDQLAGETYVDTGTTHPKISIQLRWESGDWHSGAGTDPNPYNGINLKCNSIILGNYYDMPHSPDLSLKISIESDGIKTIQTKGGATLSNAAYTKPADWGEGGAWQLSQTLDDGTQSPVASNFRNGRRVWDLSFSYLSDTDVFPVNPNQSHVAHSTDGYYVDNNNPTTGFEDIADDDASFSSNILDGQDFFSSVWNRTAAAGNLPFIFQPDKNNKNEFAIARFDMDSLTYNQVANNVYNIKLKIRESW